LHAVVPKRFIAKLDISEQFLNVILYDTIQCYVGLDLSPFYSLVHSVGLSYLQWLVRKMHTDLSSSFPTQHLALGLEGAFYLFAFTAALHGELSPLEEK
jgi:hypothetical protein